MNKLRPIDLTYGAIFVCLMAIGANIAVWFPFLAIPIGGASVPLSLQTFFAILAGVMLGKKVGTFAMAAYLFLGICGVPIFAGMQGGPFVLLSPTGGFLISYIFVAFFTGWITESIFKKSTPLYIGISLLGLSINYILGVTYMYLAMNFWLELDISYWLAWAGMIPFLIKDTVLAVVIAVFIPRLEKRLPALLKQGKSNYT